jgi:hypothetical protein
MWNKLNKLSQEKFGEDFSTLSEEEMSTLINLKKADRIAQNTYGEFGFATCKEDEMEEIINTNPILIKSNNIKLQEVKKFQKIAGL